jgi:hypothetical protein
MERGDPRLFPVFPQGEVHSASPKRYPAHLDFLQTIFYIFSHGRLLSRKRLYLHVPGLPVHDRFTIFLIACQQAPMTVPASG